MGHSKDKIMTENTNKFKSIREKLKNKNLLKTVALTGALLTGSGLTVSEKTIQGSNSQDTNK